MQRVGDLELEQDLEFEQKEWTVQRVGRVVMGLIVIAALVGFFGAGPLSHTNVRHRDGDLSLTYERFGRRGATTTLVAELGPAAVTDRQATLWLSTAYLENMRIEQITPTPDKVSTTPSGYLYTFLAGEQDDELVITFDLTIDAIGPQTGSIGLDENDPVEITHFFTP